MMPPFASQGNFLDPRLTSDGKPYGPFRLKQITQERYEISKRIHTSYVDLGKITPIERQYLMQFIHEDMEHDSKVADKIKQSMKRK